MVMAKVAHLVAHFFDEVLENFPRSVAYKLFFLAPLKTL